MGQCRHKTFRFVEDDKPARINGRMMVLTLCNKCDAVGLTPITPEGRIDFKAIEATKKKWLEIDRRRKAESVNFKDQIHPLFR